MQTGNWIGVAYIRNSNDLPDAPPGSATRQNKSPTCIDILMKLYLSNKETHCEIVLPFKSGEKFMSDECLAYGVTSDKGVFKERRKFSKNSYKFMYLAIDDLIVKRVRDFCDAQVGKPYNQWGMIWSVLWPIQERDDCYWCAHFVARVLKEAGIIKYYRSTALETSEIIKLLIGHPQLIIGTSPRQLESKIYGTIDSYFSVLPEKNPDTIYS